MGLGRNLEKLLELTGMESSAVADKATNYHGEPVSKQAVHAIVKTNQQSSKFSSAIARVFGVNAGWFSAKGKTDEAINEELLLLGRNIKVARESMALSYGDFSKAVLEMAYNNFESNAMIELGFEFDDKNELKISREQSQINIELMKQIEAGQCMMLMLERLEEVFVNVLCAVVQTTPDTLRHARIEKGVIQQGNMVDIPNLSATASMGPGVPCELDHDGVLSRISLKIDYIKEHMSDISSPNNLRTITGYGDSMKGTFNHLDQIFVDVGVTTADVDGIYVFTIHDELFIKRLQRRPQGGFLVISDNSKYQPITLNKEECADLRILGKAHTVWGAKKL